MFSYKKHFQVENNSLLSFICQIIRIEENIFNFILALFIYFK